MKYLKLFDTEDNYLTYRNGDDYLKPNISLLEGSSTVLFNYPPPPKTNGYAYVDLGLPSGTLWATCNVGANKPSEYGKYFQWADTQGYVASQVGTGEGKKKFSFEECKYNKNGSFTKYTTTGATLELEDDAAHANMGGSWHMPSSYQVQELIDYTTTAWTISDGVSGMTFTSKKDTSKSIFIPAAGDALYGSIEGSGVMSRVWSSMLDPNLNGSYLGLDSKGASTSSYPRGFGSSVRGVIGPNISSGTSATNGYEFVDLGLISGTLWATSNVGASKPTDFGQYFQWGDTVGYTADQIGKDKQFSWADYKFSIDGSSSNFSKYKTTGATLELADDAAHVNMGGDWHMPTSSQIKELLDSTTPTGTAKDGVSGVTFTSKKDTSKSIFFPAAGIAERGVWSSMLWYDVSNAYALLNGQPNGCSRDNGFSVRGVIG